MKSLIQKLTIVACLVLILAEISFAQQKTQLPEGISLVDVGSDRDCFEVKNDTVRVVLGISNRSLCQASKSTESSSSGWLSVVKLAVWI